MAILFGCRYVQVRPGIPIVSFTFDDFPQSALLEGGAILKAHQCVGTFYVSFGLMGKCIDAGPGFRAEDLHKAIEDGHELGCHTFGHCHSWETSPDKFEDSIMANREALAAVVPGAAFHTLSYPISHPRPETKRRAAKFFPCCRGGGITYNLGKTDASNLRAVFLEKTGDRSEKVEQLIKENSEACGWLILATHDVSKSPTRLGCRSKVFDEIVQCAIESGSTVLPVAKAWDVIRGDVNRNERSG